MTRKGLDTIEGNGEAQRRRSWFRKSTDVAWGPRLDHGHRFALRRDHRLENVGSSIGLSEGQRCSRPSTINSTAAVDISPPRPLASHAIRYFNTRDETLPSVVDGYPRRDAFPSSISSITDILARSPHCRGHPHRESRIPRALCPGIVDGIYDCRLVRECFIPVDHQRGPSSVSFEGFSSYPMSNCPGLLLIIEVEVSGRSEPMHIGWIMSLQGKHDGLRVCSSTSWFTLCSPVVIADDGSGGLAARREGRHVTLFRWQCERIARAMSNPARSQG